MLQFSVARYHSGATPDIDVGGLRKMLVEFGNAHGLGAPQRTSEGRGHNNFVAGDFLSSHERIAAWYVTNGKDVAFVTYVVQAPNDPRVDGELGDASALVSSLDFS